MVYVEYAGFNGHVTQRTSTNTFVDVVQSVFVQFARPSVKNFLTSSVCLNASEKALGMALIVIYLGALNMHFQKAIHIIDVPIFP